MSTSSSYLRNSIHSTDQRIRAVAAHWTVSSGADPLAPPTPWLACRKWGEEGGLSGGKGCCLCGEQGLWIYRKEPITVLRPLDHCCQLFLRFFCWLDQNLWQMGKKLCHLILAEIFKLKCKNCTAKHLKRMIKVIF
jgi:hypothetical protein